MSRVSINNRCIATSMFKPSASKEHYDKSFGQNVKARVQRVAIKYGQRFCSRDNEQDDPLVNTEKPWNIAHSFPQFLHVFVDTIAITAMLGPSLTLITLVREVIAGRMVIPPVVGDFIGNNRPFPMTFGNLTLYLWWTRLPEL